MSCLARAGFVLLCLIAVQSSDKPLQQKRQTPFSKPTLSWLPKFVMIKAIHQFFEQFLSIEVSENAEADERTLRLATAALFIEMMHTDGNVDSQEEIVVARSLKDKFDLSEDEVNQLIKLAKQERKQATDYYQFTSLINKGYDLPMKIHIVERLWEVAFADSVIDKYEEHMVRKIAELLYVPHTDFIAAKHRAQLHAGLR